MTAPAAAVKVMEVLFAGTVTVAGTVRIGALLERAMDVSVAGAFESVTVHPVLAFAASEAAWQTREVTCAGADRDSGADTVVPFKVALTVAD